MGLSKKTRTVTTDLTCQQCGNVQSIQRRKAQQRTPGHIKHLWCHICKERTPHIEAIDQLNGR